MRQKEKWYLKKKARENYRADKSDLITFGQIFQRNWHVCNVSGWKFHGRSKGTNAHGARRVSSWLHMYIHIASAYVPRAPVAFLLTLRLDTSREKCSPQDGIGMSNLQMSLWQCVGIFSLYLSLSSPRVHRNARSRLSLGYSLEKWINIENVIGVSLLDKRVTIRMTSWLDIFRILEKKIKYVEGSMNIGDGIKSNAASLFFS